MKKILSSRKGFTLVELLAVIVIMGILITVTIPSITRVIENSRKDTFVDTAKSYVNAAKALWADNTLTCGGKVSSAVGDGDYYILINTKESAKKVLPTLIDQGGKSSWGNRDVNGYVRVHVETVADSNGEPKRTTTFYVGLSDGTHGLIDDGSMTSDRLTNGDVKINLSSDDKKKVELTGDYGELNCSDNGLGGYDCTEVTPVTEITGICVDKSALNGGTTVAEPVSFASDDWATIAKAAKIGTYVGKYNLGDTKEVDLGSLGIHTVRIANTSKLAECNQGDYSQTACGFVIEFTDFITRHVMNSTKTNVGGWPASDLREYLNGEIYDALPEELRKVIVSTRVISGYGSSDDSSNFISTDKLYLLDAKEVYGTSFDDSNSTSKDSERQLDYYLEQGVTTSNYSAALKQRAHWWLRSATSVKDGFFYCVFQDGRQLATLPTFMLGVSPAFRIA